MQSSEEEHITSEASEQGVIAIRLPKRKRTLSWLLTRLSLVLALVIGYLLTDRLIGAYSPSPARVSSVISATPTPTLVSSEDNGNLLGLLWFPPSTPTALPSDPALAAGAAHLYPLWHTGLPRSRYGGRESLSVSDRVLVASDSSVVALYALKSGQLLASYNLRELGTDIFSGAPVWYSATNTLYYISSLKAGSANPTPQRRDEMAQIVYKGVTTP